MGDNFALVYASLTMGYWEEMKIWVNNPFSQYIVFMVIISTLFYLFGVVVPSFFQLLLPIVMITCWVYHLHMR